MSVTTSNDGSDARVERFKADVADMRLRDPATGLDRLLLRLGVLGMVAGPVLAVAGYFLAHSATGPLQQRDAIVQAIVGLCVSVVGAALYVKSALTGFLRFWMARFVYEQRAQATKSDVMT
ncbi:MAG TPA: hypothetical protein VIL36_12665 [Acidimicrobiales bacterium]